ncbi:hypothetical protein Tdes44962_MAKER03028 [Teratosphaeria destructans]|uniref:Uncharacterized protein n=1 Tax=Teratosphaeria destructans TaxID=418781 RepID=A0A9W7SRX4_9PEZI|nr:hypothetical protein Tdes44962_MAKER03028 [Teratosphaeria destructans]
MPLRGMASPIPATDLSQRSAFDLFKECLQRQHNLELKLSEERIENGRKEQEHLAQLGALQLSYYSLTTWQAQTQHQLQETLAEKEALHTALDQQHVRIDELQAHLSREKDLNRHHETLYDELLKSHSAIEEMTSQQSLQLDRQSKELEATYATAKELGDLASTVLLTDGENAGTFSLTDLMAHDKYQELEIVELREELDYLRSLDGGEYVPLLEPDSDWNTHASRSSERATTPIKVSLDTIPVQNDNKLEAVAFGSRHKDVASVEQVALALVEDDAREQSESSAYLGWHDYRTERPLREDDFYP